MNKYYGKKMVLDMGMVNEEKWRLSELKCDIEMLKTNMSFAYGGPFLYGRVSGRVQRSKTNGVNQSINEKKKKKK
ncbi:hypothetical protein BLOT_007229 [Blomia tropicalis]|nr:hypothetical protein BLOT_007229 [Blomia tropicalis]